MTLNRACLSLSFLALLFMGLVFAPSSVYALAFSFKVFGFPGTSSGTTIFDVNNDGQFVGSYPDTRFHGFICDGLSGSCITIDHPAGGNTQAFGLNDLEQIVGMPSFFRDTGGTFSSVAITGAMSTLPFGINDSGLMVGDYSDSSGTHGFIQSIGSSSFVSIDVTGSSFTRARNINDMGDVVGVFVRDNVAVGFLREAGGTLIELRFPGAEQTAPSGINNAGTIVGQFYEVGGQSDPKKRHGFLRDSTGIYSQFDVPGASETNPFGINDAGEIVGEFGDDHGSHGFLATPLVVDKTPPVITVSANPTTLSPPNGRLVPVTVSGTITDESDGSGVQASTYRVIDEYGQIQPSGSMTLVNGGYTFTVALQASRRGNDQDGRHYTIEVRATDYAGNRSVTSATVTVPHN